MRRSIAVVVALVVLVPARPRPARADLGGAIYEDVRDVIEELIEAEVSKSVVASIEARSPVIAAYFHRTLERLASPYWGSLAAAMREDVNAVIGDFVYWMAATDGAGDDVIAAAKTFFATAAVEPGHTLLDAECRRVEPPANRRVACHLGLAVRAALEGRAEARHHLLDGIADLLLGEIEDAGLARRLREVLTAWMEAPTSLPAALTDVVSAPDTLAYLGSDQLAALCADRAQLRAYLEDPKSVPGWGCFAISAAALPDSLQLDVEVFDGKARTTSKLRHWQLEELLDGIPDGDWGDHVLYDALFRHAVPSAPTADATITVRWLDVELAAKLNAQGKWRGAQSKELARWMKRFQRVTREVAKLREAMPPALSDLLFVADAGRPDAAQILAAVARMGRFSAQLQARWYLWQSEGGDLANIDIVALLDLARATIAETGRPEPAGANLLVALGDWLRLAVRADHRELAMLALRAGLGVAKDRADRPHETFFVALAAYLLDAPDAGGEELTRGAFKSAAKQLLLSAANQGVPGTDDRIAFRWLPRVALRMAVDDEYAVAPGDRTRRAVVAADWPTFMIAFNDHVGVELSVLDPVAPLAELALRPAGDYHDEKWIALDAVRPRLGLWTAMPQLSRRLALSLGAGARLVGVDVESAAGDPLEARYVKRASLTIDAGIELVF